MLVQFMQNTSAEIVVDKTISTSKDVDCKLKQDCSLLEPVLIVYDINLNTYNYAYIPDMSRYYYVDQVYTLNQKTTEIHLKVDVLMSFKDDILASKGIIERNEEQFIKYISDEKYTVLNYERIQTKLFPRSLPTDAEFILIVAGS